MRSTSYSVLILTAVMIIGCAKAPEPVQVAGWNRYQDPYFRASFTHPQGWHIVPEGNKITMYSSQDAVERFLDPTAPGKAGIQLVVAYEKPDTARSLDVYVEAFRSDRSSEGYTVNPSTSRTISGSPGVQVEYSGRVDETTTLKAIRAFALKDSVIYYMHFAAFNESFEPNRFLFDTLMASVQIREMRAAAPGASTAPSTETLTYSNNLLEITHPSNFDATFPTPRGGAEFSLELKGYRQDCTIRIDVLPAKGLTVEKVVEQNLKFFKPKSRGTATINGAKAMYLNDSPARSIERRVYFLVKNDRVYRMIFNYYQPMKNDYLPAFEKTIASVRVK